MKIVSWNIRGLGGLEKRKEVRKLIGDLGPSILCLQETKLQSCDASLVLALWGSSPHAFSYRPSVGASGGLVTIWDSSEVDVWSSESHDHVLWCHGRFITSGVEFFVANVYAPCEDGAKRRLWDSLSARLQSLGRSRICVCGDFNAVKLVDERRSSRVGPRSVDHIPLSRFIEDNSLVDLPLHGRKFTWYKGDGLSMSRLDRFLLSEEWCMVWPNCKQVARLRSLSDHCALVLSESEEDWGPRPARMLKCWRDIPGYKLFVRDNWNSFQVDGWGGYVMKEKLKRIKAALKDWHSVHAQNLPSQIDSKNVRLAVLDQKGEDEDLSEAELAELHGVTSDIHALSRLHASISWQQSRAQWLKEGDANTKYFHSVLASRRRRNTISVIQVGGVTLEGVNPIRQAVFSHFASHFKALDVERPGCDNLHFRQLSQLESGSLTKPFSEAEVKAAVWDCDSYKSLGPDGVNFGFYKDFWEDLRGDVMRFISDFHRNGKLTKGLYSTFIALIPKVLPNRLRLVIGSVISESQTAFVKNRQILDGILIANEVVDEAKRSKKELLLFKVDFEKAYDSVDWGYLDDVMGKMAFPVLWRKWIKECVRTATASVLVNGSPTEEFPLERGLRQGDPLSPFLFLLAAEGLNVLMEAVVEHNLFTGYRVGEQDPVVVSHLQFADDTLLLGAKSWANVRALRAVLVLFETMSGLKVNFNKSMLVGVNIPDSWLGEAASVLRCRVGKVPFLYLGLPIGGDPRRLAFWDPVVSRLKTRLSGWKNRFLSFGGHLVLLKSVLTSLPVYALSFFKAPSGKWCWRMLVDRAGLWYRVLVARYGVEGGRVRDGGRRGSAWWKEFGRLYDLAETKQRTVAEMSLLGWGAEGGPGWQWQPDPDIGYTVRGAYHLLTYRDSTSMDAVAMLVWHPHVPLKVSIFAWRLLRDSRWLSGASFLYAAHLACVRVGGVDREESQVVPWLSELSSSVVGQDQAFLF
ncbi:hypothetical protein P8452_14152 [Trifolium repens]|nr:hypothetical protein P8452_14152 [Trifolium repens]